MLGILAAAAFVAGLTGSWSPCGFSMVSTLGPSGHSGGRLTTLAACAAFVPGALAGGVLTFGSLSLIGALLGGGGTALLTGAAIAGAAALAEAAGVRIVPQIRRQVPEHWRRVMPLPAAGAAYGVLLGLGFTTFVLTFAVPALAGVALAVGDPAAGLALGLAFGAGRALPGVGLAPLAERPLGLRASDRMAERPAILRGFRAADAAALAAVALALGAQSASAQTTPFAAPATDPSAAGADVAWKVPGGPAVIRTPTGEATIADAQHAAIGGRYTAALVAGEIRVTDRATGTELVRHPAPDADKVAVSDVAVVWRERAGRIVARVHATGEVRVLAEASAGALGRPALDGGRVVFHVAGPTASRILLYELASGEIRTLRRSRRASLTNPSLLGNALLYVSTTQWSQSLVLRGRPIAKIAPAITADKGYSTKHGPHRRVRRPRRPPKTGPRGTTTTLWTTALAADAAYVTRLRQRGATTTADLLRVAR